MESLDQRVAAAQAVVEVPEGAPVVARPWVAAIVSLLAIALFAATVLLQQPAFLVAALVIIALAVWSKNSSRFLNTTGVALIGLGVIWLLLNRYWLYAGVTMFCGLFGGFLGGRKRD